MSGCALLQPVQQIADAGADAVDVPGDDLHATMHATVTERCQTQTKAGAAAAGRDGVRVPDLEGLAHQVVDEVDHRAAHVDQRQIVDQHGRAVLLDGDVVVVAAHRPGRTCRRSRSSRRLRRRRAARSCPVRRRRSSRCAWRRRRSRRPSWRSWRQRPLLASPCFRVPIIGMKRRGASQPDRRLINARHRGAHGRRGKLGDIGFGYRPRAPYACDPAAIARPLLARAGEPDAHAVPARPRPHHPFHRLPPAQAQDAGLLRA